TRAKISVQRRRCQRSNIISMKKLGFRPGRIAKLARCCCATVYNALRRAPETKPTSDRPRQGRPRKPTRQVKANIKQLRLNPTVGTIRRAQVASNNTGNFLSVGTV